MIDKKKFQDEWTKMCHEGLDYWLENYLNIENFNGDQAFQKDLKQAAYFITVVRNGMESYAEEFDLEEC